MKTGPSFRYLFCLLIICFFYMKGFAQSSEIYHGDTINRMDSKSQKQGKWLVFNSLNKYEGYNDSALVQELYFKDGKKEGLIKTFFPSGKIKSQVVYKENRPFGNAKFYYPNGNLAEEGNWVHGSWDGKYNNYYEAGTKSEDLEYTFGKKDGIQKSYHLNGKLKSESVWKNGEPDGIEKDYNEQGKLISMLVFVNGDIDEKESKYFMGTESENTEPVWQQATDSLGVFNGTGFFKLKNKMGLVSKEGYFRKGSLEDGKQFYYDADTKQVTKTIFYKAGKMADTADSK